MQFGNSFKIGIIIFVEMFFIEVSASDQSDLDHLLLEQLKSDNYLGFVSALENGADPNRMFSGDPNDWAMCYATRSGSEKYLQTLVDFGGQVDLVNPDNPSQLSSMPIACSIHHRNANSFEFLVQAGVDVDVNLCVNCDPKFVTSPLIVSLIAGEYTTTLRLIDLSTVRKKDVDGMIIAMENWPLIESSRHYPARLKIIQYLQDSGYSIDPWVPGKNKNRK